MFSSSSFVEIGGASINTTVTLTDATSDINSLVTTFLANNNNTKKIIGLDTEEVQESGKRFKTVLLQLCDEYYNLPRSLFNFLNIPDFTFVGFNIKKTLTKLESEWGLTCKHAVEIGPSTWNLKDKTDGEKSLVSDNLSTPKPTSPIFDHWEKFLNEDQIMLATYNAYYAFGLGNVLLDGFDY